MIPNLPRRANLARMTNAQRVPQISYDHGVSDKKLIGETIGAFFDRTGRDLPRPRGAGGASTRTCAGRWGELGRRVDDLAAGLMSLGLERGDRVGIWSPNTSEWTLAQFATAKAGLVLVNVNPAYRRAELEYAMNKVECKALILAPALKTSNYLEIVEDLVKAKKLPHLKHDRPPRQGQDAGHAELRRRRARPAAMPSGSSSPSSGRSCSSTTPSTSSSPRAPPASRRARRSATTTS